MKRELSQEITLIENKPRWQQPPNLVQHKNNPSNNKAPSTGIRIFLNPQLFLSGFKNFHVHTCPYLNSDFFFRIRIHSSTQDSSGNIGNRARVLKRTKLASCSVLCSGGRFSKVPVTFRARNQILKSKYKE